MNLTYPEHVLWAQDGHMPILSDLHPAVTDVGAHFADKGAMPGEIGALAQGHMAAHTELGF